MFAITKSGHRMNCFQVIDPDPKLRSYVIRVIRSNHFDDPRYALRKDCGAFLQCDHESYVLVEFWSENIEAMQKFVDHIRDNWEKEII